MNLLDQLRARPIDDDPGAAPNRNLARPAVGRRTVEQRLDHLAEQQQLVAGHATEMLSLLQSGVVNQVMESATRTVGAAGVLTREFQAPFAGVSILNPTGAFITVQEGAATGAPQGDGPGSLVVPPLAIVTFPLTGRFLNFFATAGTRFSYCVLARRPEASGGMGAGNPTAFLAESSAAQLANAVVNGATRPAAGYAKLRGFASSDVAGTLAIQQARLAAGPWFTTTSQPVAAGFTTGTVVESILTLPFARVQYTNGAAAQASFELDSTLVAI